MPAAVGEPDTLSQLATVYLQRFDWIVTFVEEYIRERSCPVFFSCCDEKALGKSNSGNKGFLSASVLGLSSMVRKFGKLGYTEITTREQRDGWIHTPTASFLHLHSELTTSTIETSLEMAVSVPSAALHI